MSSIARKPWVPTSFAVLATAVLAATLAGWWRVLFGTTDPYSFFDLDFYRRSLDAVANGGLLYDSLAYPPVTMILLSPLRGLPVLAGNMLWTGLSLLTGVGLAVGLAHLTTPAESPPARGSRKLGRRTADPPRGR